jgi:hypothetical protein
MIENTTALMKLDDEMLTTVSGGHGRGRGHCKGKKRGWDVRQSNEQTFTSGDITITVNGDLSGSLFIGNSASNSVA